ncbi:MAG: L,D-transpeptidase family protein [Eubacterium sp.]|nr:L,D-transpeptidase family protein [Eubacterium sp.]
MKKNKKVGAWIVLMFGLLIGVFLGGQLIYFAKIRNLEQADTEKASEKQTELVKEIVSEEEPEKEHAHWVEMEGKRSFINEDGVLLKNTWVTENGQSRYLGYDGYMVTGFCWVDGKLRYFEADGRLRKEIGWLYKDGNRYYIDDFSNVVYGQKKKIGEDTYYFNRSGVMQTGKIEVGSDSFIYAGNNGAILYDQDFELDGLTYHADADGVVFVGTMYEKAQGYGSDTDFLILCNLATQKTAVFKGKKGQWRLLREMIVSTGAPINPTPKGEYKTTIHTEHFNSYGVRAWYATGFIGGLYLFHSSPYEIDSAPRVCTDPRLGVAASHGCVRMALEDAKWMYDTLPLRTKVVIYEE